MYAARQEVERMLQRRMPFCAIEEHIDGIDAAEDVKAALWLFAWSEQGRATRRQLVDEALTVSLRPQG